MHRDGLAGDEGDEGVEVAAGSPERSAAVSMVRGASGFTDERIR
jgi:hypothetical protein